LFEKGIRMKLIMDHWVKTFVDEVVDDVLSGSCIQVRLRVHEELTDLVRFYCLEDLSGRGYVDFDYRRWDDIATFTVNKRKIIEARGKPFSRREWTKFRKVSYVVPVGEEWSVCLREMVRHRRR
jgi:hypothetical protein